MIFVSVTPCNSYVVRRVNQNLVDLIVIFVSVFSVLLHVLNVLVSVLASHFSS